MSLLDSEKLGALRMTFSTDWAALNFTIIHDDDDHHHDDDDDEGNNDDNVDDDDDDLSNIIIMESAVVPIVMVQIMSFG